jgi:hypothetical protein
VVSAADPPTVVNLSFIDRSRNFLSSSFLLIFIRAELTPFQTHCYSENLVAPGIEPGDYEEWCLLGCYAVWLL